MPEKYCSFCARKKSECRVLVSGPSVWICDQCIQIAQEQVDDTLSRLHRARPAQPIPVMEAGHIAKVYGYDQVVVIARRVSELLDGCEHVTTYGRDKEHCEVAAHIGEFLKFRVMNWAGETKHESS